LLCQSEKLFFWQKRFRPSPETIQRKPEIRIFPVDFDELQKGNAHFENLNGPEIRFILPPSGFFLIFRISELYYIWNRDTINSGAGIPSGSRKQYYERS